MDLRKVEEEVLLLTKGGKLIDHRWNPDRGEYESIDATDQALSYMFDNVVFDDNLTLRDVLLFVQKHKDMWTIISNQHVDAILKEGFTRPPQIKSRDNEPPLEYLELYWIISRVREYELYKDGPKKGEPGSIWEQMGYDRTGEFTGPKKLIGYRFPDFHGVSAILEEDWDHYKKGERIQYSISFTPISDMMHLKVILNKQICICDDVVNSDWSKDNTELYEDCEYSLGQAIHGILYELTWHGSPEDRDDRKNDLMEAVENVKNEEKEEMNND